MTRERVWEAVSSFLVREFGRLLEVRDVRRIRHVAGSGWTVTVVLSATSGDLHVADIGVDENGAMTPQLDANAVMAAVRRAQTVSKLPAPHADDDIGDIAGFTAKDDASDGLDMLEMDGEPVEIRIENAIKKGDPSSLREARDLLPHLLRDHDTRGATLLAMAEVEIKLGAVGLAKGYIEAAARELSDRFDIPSLERSAAVALKLLGKEAFVTSPVHGLLEESRARLKPLQDLFACRSFAALPASLRESIEPAISLRTLAPGENLVIEGEASSNVFVVKSGLLGVWLEKPSGGQWLVRCCFPGWLLGESSVLAENARCTATLRAERVSEVWTIPAATIRAAMNALPAFAERIAATKETHRIDSFFSMHETMSQLDVQVRDEMLSCIQRLETFDVETMVSVANEVPRVACLVARGEISLFEPGKQVPAAIIVVDGFHGVRDAIHEMASGFDAIAKPNTTIAFFDADRLRALCLRSPARVVAVLERLG